MFAAESKTRIFVCLFSRRLHRETLFSEILFRETLKFIRQIPCLVATKSFLSFWQFSISFETSLSKDFFERIFGAISAYYSDRSENNLDSKNFQFDLQFQFDEIALIVCVVSGIIIH